MTKDYAEARAALLRELDGLRVEVDAEKRIGYLILDRPPLNIVSYRARSQIRAVIEAMDEDAEVGVIVIRGAGGTFTSGGDVKSFPAIPFDGMSDLAWNIAAPEASAEALDAHCRASSLARFKRPRAYVFVARIPRSASGKLLRRLLRDGAYEPLPGFVSTL